MTPTQYETTLVIDAHLSNEQIESAVEKYTKIIEENSGVVKLIDRWGKRRLAYEIKKKQYGFYVYIRFEAPGTVIKLMERQIKLDDAIIRHLTVIVPKVVLNNENLQPVQDVSKPKSDDISEDANSSEPEETEDSDNDEEEDDVSEKDEE